MEDNNQEPAPVTKKDVEELQNSLNTLATK